MFTILAMTIFFPALVQTSSADNSQRHLDPAIVQFAMANINQFYRAQGDLDARTLVNFTEDRKQTVSGVSYTLSLDVKYNTGDELCRLTVLRQGSLDSLEVTDGPSCKEQYKVVPTGGQRPIDQQTEDVKNALKAAMADLDTRTGHVHTLVKITRVTKQVVAGYMYRFRGVEICTQTDPQKSCEGSKTSKSAMCSFDVWWRDWLNPPYTIQLSTCTDNSM